MPFYVYKMFNKNYKLTIFLIGSFSVKTTSNKSIRIIPILFKILNNRIRISKMLQYTDRYSIFDHYRFVLEDFWWELVSKFHNVTTSLPESNSVRKASNRNVFVAQSHVSNVSVERSFWSVCIVSCAPSQTLPAYKLSPWHAKKGNVEQRRGREASNITRK